MYNIYSTQPIYDSNPITHSLLGRQTRIAVEDIVPSRTTSMEGLSPSATQADYGSRPSSPKRQCEEEDGETSRVNRKKLSQEQ